MKKVNFIKTVACFFIGASMLASCQKEKTSPASEETGAVKYAEFVPTGVDTRDLGARPDWMGVGGTLAFLEEGINLPTRMPGLFINDGDNIPSGILVTKKSYVYVTYVGNVAAFNNVLGYYYYNKADGIDGVGVLNSIYSSGIGGVHFKNIIYDHTKDLDFGYTFKLSDDNGDMFEPGTVIGFCVMPNAGGGATTDASYKTQLPNVKMKDGKPIFIATNREVNENTAISHIMGQSACGDLIIAFEDLNSEYSATSDQDFNDLIFLVGDNLTDRTTDNIEAYSIKSEDIQLWRFGENCERLHCGEDLIISLVINEKTTAGKVTVWNDAVNLYVNYSTEDGWYLDKTCLYVGDCDINKMEPDKFPHHYTHNPCVTTKTYTIPLAQLPKCVCIASYAEVVKFKDGVKGTCEKAWGFGDKIDWGMKFGYCIQNCGVEEPEPCYGDSETAWTQGPDYGGNWAMYTPYAVGDVDIMAGQNKLAGKATFSPVVNGKVTITISLDGWALQDVAEAVKIQGYASAPSGNPAPGQFKTYKGKDLIVTVDAYAFYGIHLDLRKIVDCR